MSPIKAKKTNSNQKEIAGWGGVRWVATPSFPYGSPSNTREIRSEFSFFHENDTFFDFLIDF